MPLFKSKRGARRTIMPDPWRGPTSDGGIWNSTIVSCKEVVDCLGIPRWFHSSAMHADNLVSRKEANNACIRLDYFRPSGPNDRLDRIDSTCHLQRSAP